MVTQDMALAALGTRSIDPEIRAEIAREHRQHFGLLAPALILMGVLLLVPMAWLAWLSFLDEQGAVTLQNYIAVLTEPAYARSMWLTLWMSAAVTAFCAVVGYVLAYAMAQMHPLAAKVCLLLVALPFWTSVLVRTYAWLVLLQYRGIVNNALLDIGVVDAPLRMMHNTTGALIGMFHIMLPFMVFPLYAAMRKVDPSYMQAAKGLGASQNYAFWKVYFPQTLPGLLAGAVLVFILSLGFYVTPALLGGGKTIVMAIALERDVALYRSWGPASAAAILFVSSILILLAMLNRYLPIERLFQR